MKNLLKMDSLKSGIENCWARNNWERKSIWLFDIFDLSSHYHTYTHTHTQTIRWIYIVINVPMSDCDSHRFTTFLCVNVSLNLFLRLLFFKCLHSNTRQNGFRIRFHYALSDSFFSFMWTTLCMFCAFITIRHII